MGVSSLVAAQSRGEGWVVRRREERRERSQPSRRECDVVDSGGRMEKMTVNS